MKENEKKIESSNLLTLVWPDSFVTHPDVLDQVGLLVESVLAKAANERTLVEVNRTKVAVKIAFRFVLKVFTNVLNRLLKRIPKIRGETLSYLETGLKYKRII